MVSLLAQGLVFRCLDATHHHLADRANQLGPAKALLDELALLHRDAIARSGWLAGTKLSSFLRVNRPSVNACTLFIGNFGKSIIFDNAIILIANNTGSSMARQ